MQQPIKSQIGLREVVGGLWRQRFLAAAVFVLTVLGALAGAWYLPDRYEARMKVLVKNTRADLVVTPDQQPNAANLSEVTETQLNSEAELIRSQDLLEQLVRANHLAAANDPQEIEKAVRQLEKSLSVAPLKKADLIEVKYSAASPQLAANVLEQLGKLYLDKHLQTHRPAGTYDFFKTQTEAYAQELRAAETKLESYRQKNNLISLDQQKNIGLQRLSDTQSKLRDTDGDLNDATQRIAALSQQLSRVAPRISTQQRVVPNQFTAERLTTLLVELRNRRAQLLSKFQPADRLIKEMDEQIRLTGEELEKARQTTAVEQSSDVNPLRQTLEAGLTQTRVEQAGRQALRSNLAAQEQLYRAQVGQLENATRTHEDLARRAQEAKENYQLYAQKQEEARIADALDEKKISNVTIAEPPRLPALPAAPNRPLIVLTGVVLGLLLSAGCVVSREFFRDTIATPEELARLTGCATLATLPVQPPRYLATGPAAKFTTGRVIAELNKPRPRPATEEEPAEETPWVARQNDYEQGAWRSNIRSVITIGEPYS